MKCPVTHHQDVGTEEFRKSHAQHGLQTSDKVQTATHLRAALTGDRKRVTVLSTGIILSTVSHSREKQMWKRGRNGLRRDLHGQVLC